MGRDAERAGGEVAAMGRDAERAGRRVEASASAAGGETQRSTGIMSAAWKGLDILDDVGGVLGMIDDLTVGLRTMAEEAIQASREVEYALGHLASVNIGMTDTEMAWIRQWADDFVLGRAGQISQLVATDTVAIVQALTSATSSGLDMPTAQVAVTQAAGLSMLKDAGTVESILSALASFTVMRDERELAPQFQEWANMIADTQRRFKVDSMLDFVEAVSSSIGMAAGYGLSTEEWLSYLGATHLVTPGSEAGEALNTILEGLPLGMQELGLTVPETDGKLDFVAALQGIRDYREQRSDLSEVGWMMLLGEAFDDLAAKEISTITGKNWEAFSSAIPGLTKRARMTRWRSGSFLWPTPAWSRRSSLPPVRTR